MRIWQLVSIGHYLHCLKVDGDGEENQCGCKQCNSRVMCSSGQATVKKSCQGTAEQRQNSPNSLAIFTRPFPLPHSIHMHISACGAGVQSCLFLPPLQNANSVEPPIKVQDGRDRILSRSHSDIHRGDVLVGE